MIVCRHRGRAPQREGVTVCNTLRGSPLWRILHREAAPAGEEPPGVSAPPSCPRWAPRGILPGALGAVAASRALRAAPRAVHCGLARGRQAGRVRRRWPWLPACPARHRQPAGGSRRAGPPGSSRPPPGLGPGARGLRLPSCQRGSASVVNRAGALPEPFAAVVCFRKVAAFVFESRRLVNSTPLRGCQRSLFTFQFAVIFLILFTVVILCHLGAVVGALSCCTLGVFSAGSVCSLPCLFILTLHVLRAASPRACGQARLCDTAAHRPCPGWVSSASVCTRMISLACCVYKQVCSSYSLLDQFGRFFPHKSRMFCFLAGLQKGEEFFPSSPCALGSVGACPYTFLPSAPRGPLAAVGPEERSSLRSVCQKRELNQPNQISVLYSPSKFFFPIYQLCEVLGFTSSSVRLLKCSVIFISLVMQCLSFKVSVTICVFEPIRPGLALLLYRNNKNIVLFSTLSFNPIKYHSTVVGFFGYRTFICLLLCNLHNYFFTSYQINC